MLKLHGCVFLHSYGENLANIIMTKLTEIKVIPTYTQISGDNGFKNENNPGLLLVGTLYGMLIPKLKKGLVKSTTCCLLKLIVNADIAKSAF